ncbi:unnamed protein product, partial [marine sediment metagenome]
KYILGPGSSSGGFQGEYEDVTFDFLRHTDKDLRLELDAKLEKLVAQGLISQETLDDYDDSAMSHVGFAGHADDPDNQVQRQLNNINDEARRNWNKNRGGQDITGMFSQFGAFRDLLNQTNPFASEFMGLKDQAVAGQESLFGLSTEALSNMISGTDESLGPVDTSALAAAGFTDVKEKFAGMGGLFGSDIQSEQLRLGTELEVSANEAAKQRSLQAKMFALGLAPEVGSAQLGFAGNLLGLGNVYNQTETAS